VENVTMRLGPVLWSEMAEIAASAGSVQERAEALLAPLHRVVPYAAAWVAVRDPETRQHRPVVQEGATAPLAEYFALPDADDDVEQLGLNRFRPPVRASDLPMPLEDVRVWGEYLLPAGFRDGLAMGVFTDDGRHLGFISLLTDDPADRTTAYVDLIAEIRPLLAHALDRLPTLATVAQLYRDPVGGAVLTRSGRWLPVPGMPAHPLLRQDSPLVVVVRTRAGSTGTHASFLCPSAGSLLRVTVTNCREERADHLSELVMLSQPDDLADLGLTELQILGALLSGWPLARIRAECAAPDVAYRLDRLARRLGCPSIHALLMYVSAEGLYIPPPLWP
jgi:hypothetical protein